LRRAAGRHDAWRLAAPAWAQAAQPGGTLSRIGRHHPRRPRPPLRGSGCADAHHPDHHRPGQSAPRAETVLSYTALRAGEPYDNERLDQALRDLLATELFADVQIRRRRDR
jgi:hypothetical protein